MGQPRLPRPQEPRGQAAAEPGPEPRSPGGPRGGKDSPEVSLLMGRLPLPKGPSGLTDRAAAAAALPSPAAQLAQLQRETHQENPRPGLPPPALCPLPAPPQLQGQSHVRGAQRSRLG
ncbi:Dapper like protein 2 [Platysternon megacephalum]|uniref:Dapper like protein 2 n=1 Tax=Platysternon megacephalum TaxID=55544 RepID=A0A4D9DPW2_9SAUR|nr:Dapper like protein 2 [Platysternon megacephalum]